MNEISPNMNGVRQVLIGFGVMLILGGVFLLLCLGYNAFKAFQDPSSVPVVAKVSGLLNSDKPVVRGKLELVMEHGAQPANFEMFLSPDIKATLFIVMGAFVCLICAGVANVIINAGVQVIKGALYKGDIVYRRSS
jgi:hypothetical protein